jgi:hypothetical protein
MVWVLLLSTRLARDEFGVGAIGMRNDIKNHLSSATIIEHVFRLLEGGQVRQVVIVCQE